MLDGGEKKEYDTVCNDFVTFWQVRYEHTDNAHAGGGRTQAPPGARDQKVDIVAAPCAEGRESGCGSAPAADAGREAFGTGEEEQPLSGVGVRRRTAFAAGVGLPADGGLGAAGEAAAAAQTLRPGLPLKLFPNALEP